MTSNVGPGELVRELRATLESISLGLIEGLPDRLLSAEPRLAEIAARLTSVTARDAAPIREELLAARAAIRRCQHLGANVAGLADVYATPKSYGRSGHFAIPDAAGVLHARV